MFHEKIKRTFLNGVNELFFPNKIFEYTLTDKKEGRTVMHGYFLVYLNVLIIAVKQNLSLTIIASYLFNIS